MCRRIRRLEYPQADARRPGSALILVLVVIAMLSLGAYTFSSLMVTEYRAATAAGQYQAVQAWADSGVEYVAAQLTLDAGGWDADLYDNPTLFHVNLQDGGGFTVLSPKEDPNDQAAMRMGVMDESARINLNVIAALDPSTNMARNVLMGLPNMTETIADSILDWIDADTLTREFGVEAESNAIVPPRNGPLESLEELLLIEGVTPALLFGEDANRNGRLDPNENDGDQSLPSDNADGFLDLGWVEYLTLCSKEGNLQRNPDYYGQPKINVNESLLTDLYDQLEERLGATEAQFVTAYRLKGPYNPNGVSGSGSGSSSSAGGAGVGGNGSSGSTGGSGGSTSGGSGSSSSNSAGSGSLGQSSQSNSTGSTGTTGSTGSTGSSGASSSGSTTSRRQGLSSGATAAASSSGTASQASSTGNAETDQALQSMASGLASAVGGTSGTVTRSGMDVSAGGSTQIDSLYDLVGAQVNATVDGQNVMLESPWKSDPGSLQQALPSLLDILSTSADKEISGRININQARREVLLGIPGAPEGLADAIVAARAQRTAGSSGSTGRFTTAGWLLIEGLVDLETMRNLDLSVTGGGSVLRVQVLGHGDTIGPMARVEAIIDGTQPVPKVIYQRNLGELDAGFRKDQIPPFSDTSNTVAAPSSSQNNR